MYAEIYEILKNGVNEIADTKAAIKVLNEKIDSGVYHITTQKRFIEERDSLKDKLVNIADSAVEKAGAIYDVIIAQVKDRDVLNPADFLSGDIRILQSGLKLTKKDLEHMLKKPENDNSAMKRMIFQYADENNIEFTLSEREGMYSKAHIEAERLQKEKNALRYIRNWIDTDKGNSFIDSVYKEAAISEETDE